MNSKRQHRACGRDRRGSALVLVLIMTVAIAALVTSAMFLTSGASIITRQYDREREFRYASEAALQMAKSRINNQSNLLPQEDFSQILTDGIIMGADGNPIPGVQVNLYVGPTGSASGQFGRFASIVSEARDASGARYVRRLELAQESFARFAYWSNKETNNGSPIYFGGGDDLFGPVWSNDQINIHSTGARFRDDVGTAKTISGKPYGTFDKGFVENSKAIALPNNTVLGSLQGYATAADFDFIAPTIGSASTVRMRIEFVALDMNADGDSTDADEGFFRVYTGNTLLGAPWIRGNFLPENCGDWHRDASGKLKFFPAAIHKTGSDYDWFENLLDAYDGMSSSAAFAHRNNLSLDVVMRGAGARCYPGGDPHLAPVERYNQTGLGWARADWEKGGDDTTFTARGRYGEWKQWPNAVNPNVLQQLTNVDRQGEAQYLFPLFRGYNPATQGVIFVDGTVAVSGVVRGSVTLYSSRTVV
ncbi:MAG: hypothetical protein M3373_06305, partial [Gemmatimonadota bacterium]|nr:hypothetical protein [Gemmatimonadota bacterium]